MNRFRLTKRHVAIATLSVLLLLFAVIREWRSWMPRTLFFPKEDLPVLQLLWTPDGQTLLTKTKSSLYRWDMRQSGLGVGPRQLSRIHYFRANGVWLLPNNMLGVLGPTQASPSQNDIEFAIWDLEKQKQVKSFWLQGSVTLVSDKNQVIALRFKGKDKQIAVDTFDFSGQLLKQQLVKTPANIDVNGLPNIGFSPQICHVFFANLPYSEDNPSDGGLLFLDVSSGKYTKRLPWSVLSSSSYVDFGNPSYSEDGETLILYIDGKCQLRDARTGNLKQTIQDSHITQGMHWLLPKANDKWLFGFNVSQNHPRFNWAQRQSIFVWDAQTGQRLREIKVEATIFDMALSPDGSTLAVGTYQQGVKLYRMR